MKQIFIILLLILVPHIAHAAADLRVQNTDIRFSKTPLISGDDVRIYATVHNDGDVDVSGYVTFYQGSTAIGVPVVISLLSQGNPEEVYVDFVVPSGQFNIMAILQGTEPEDANISNNSAITPVIVPIQDDDRDGIENQQDNCPGLVNNNQLDSDGDGDGDACDSDDDDDGLSDDVEAELTSDPTKPDSDGDGVIDSDDAYPTNPEKHLEEQEPIVTEPTQISVPSSIPTSERFQQVVQEVARSIQEQGARENDVTLEAEAEEESFESDPIFQEEVLVSPNAVFSYQQNSWNTFTFDVVAPETEPVLYVWNFGDGVTSSRPLVEHTYTQSGAYTVTLTVTNSSGAVLTESTTILIPFFHLENRLILASLVLLLTLLLLGIWSFASLGRKNRKP